MRVFIAGATGVLGRRLVDRFAERGHAVTGLTRSAEGDAIVEARGGEPHRGNLFHPVSLARGAEGADAVIHAATAIPTGVRPSEADWRRNDRVRREGTEALTAAAAEVGAGLYLQQSITWVARQPDGSAFDENSVPHPTRVTQSALDAEYIAGRAGDREGFDVGVLRCGTFYAPDAAHTRTTGENLRKGRLPIPGGGPLGRRDAAISVLHVDDAARAFVAAAEAGVEGLWHVVDDEPVAVAALLRSLAERLDAPSPRRLPGWLLVPVLGRETVRAFTKSATTTNRRFREEVGWEPAYPTYREGLEQVVEAWQEEGFLVDGVGAEASG
ncbi:NAD-dependent epimerase/dehydratase family protein [Halegenticoccus soli]|uniref:NAD-dependent epimerase/dehydratase family protein n=1 Tax=Halegenticoccus soli TaxID=1985678 RepID=UPI000C6CBE18|nr:NAD(P)-dependent oxidoreductase [Halegenticoccus soli]